MTKDHSRCLGHCDKEKTKDHTGINYNDSLLCCFPKTALWFVLPSSLLLPCQPPLAEPVRQHFCYFCLKLELVAKPSIFPQQCINWGSHKHDEMQQLQEQSKVTV